MATAPTRPACSVIIAAYNAADTVDDAIHSVLAQTRQDFELIVVDDGSTDGTSSRVQPYTEDRRVRLERQANAGPSVARNAGIALASGHYVSMLDSDDLWLPHYLESMVRALEHAPDAGFAYTDAWALDDGSGRFRRASAMSRSSPPTRSLDRDSFLEALLKRNFVYNSVTVRRPVLERVGGYDPSLQHAEDYELWLRITASGYRGVPVPGRLAIGRDRSGARSRDEARMLAGVRHALSKTIEHQQLPVSAQAVARRRLAEIERQLAVLDGSLTIGGVGLRVKKALGRATFPVRARGRTLATPPAEIAAAFPKLGRGRQSGSDEGWRKEA